MKYFAIYSFSMLLFFSCQSQTATSVTEETKKTEDTTNTEKTKEESPTNTNPIKVLTTKNGLEVPVYEYAGFAANCLNRNEANTVYLLNFWATWCGPCVAELPHFLELEKQYKGKNVKFVFVSLDFDKELETKLIPFLENRNFQSELVVLDQTGADQWIEKIAKEWSGSIPATLIYHSKDRKFYEQKFDSAAEIEAVLKPFL